jgi:hypothetical protein
MAPLLSALICIEIPSGGKIVGHSSSETCLRKRASLTALNSLRNSEWVVNIVILDYSFELQLIAPFSALKIYLDINLLIFKQSL